MSQILESYMTMNPKFWREKLRLALDSAGLQHLMINEIPLQMTIEDKITTVTHFTVTMSSEERAVFEKMHDLTGLYVSAQEAAELAEIEAQQ